MIKTLLFGDEAVLQVVFVGQRPFAVVDGGKAAKAVVGVGDFTAVGQAFESAGHNRHRSCHLR